MTAYNREAYIGEAIESVLASDFRDFELIVVDDASKDRTVEIARAYAMAEKRVRVFENAQNLGDYPNRNKAASYALGTYLKYVDSDDRVYPWTLGAMFHCVRAFPEAGLGLAATPEVGRPYPVLLTPREAYEWHFFKRELFGRAPGSAFVSRAAFEAVGRFSGLRQVGDFEFWLKICAQFPVVLMPHGLTWDRVHEGQEKSRNTEIEKAVMRLAVILEALNNPACPLSRDATHTAMSQLRRHHLRALLRLLVSRKCTLRELLEYYRSILKPLKTRLGGLGPTTGPRR